MSARKKVAVLMAAAAVIVAAVYIAWVLDVNDVGVQPSVESGYYDQFLFAEGADVTALLEQTVDQADQLPAPDGEESDAVTWYDGALLAPWLPNCAEMGAVQAVRGGVYHIHYVPKEPRNCAQVSLCYLDGYTSSVTVTLKNGETHYANVAPPPAPPSTSAPAGPEELLEEALADPAGWADGGLYAGLGLAALFDGELLDRAAQIDPACEDPLASDRAFVLIDGAGLTPEEAAARLLEELLEYYSQEREGCGFQLTDYAVAAQELLGREEIAALAERSMQAEETPYLMRLALRDIRENYPWPPEGMWCLVPEVRVDWNGYLKLPGGAFRIWGELNDLTPAGGTGPVWVLIHDDGQWWLQRSAALTALLAER